MKIDCCEIANTPCFWADTATPFSECTGNTQATSRRTACTALWLVKPAGLIGNGASLTLVAGQVHLDLAGRGDLAEYWAVQVDQELDFGTGHERADGGRG